MGFRTRTAAALQALFGRTGARPRADAGRLLTQGRLIGAMPGISTGPNTFLRGGLKEWRAKARWMAATNPYAVQAKRALQVNLIGARGIRMRGNIRMEAQPGRNIAPQGISRIKALVQAMGPNSEPSDALLQLLGEQQKDEVRNAILEASWERFCKPSNFHIGGKLSFHQFELLTAGSLPGSGGCMIRAIYRRPRGSKVPLCFEILPMDQLDDDYNYLSERPGHYWRNGIEFQRGTNRITRYAILTEHPDEYDYRHAHDKKRVFVPADDIAHIFFQEDIGQTREIPWLMPALTTLHSMQEYETSHWTRKRVTNNLLGFIEETEPEFPQAGGDADIEEPDTMELIEDSAPGQWVKLRPGEKPHAPQFGPDDGQFGEVLRTMLRRFSAALGLSYATVSRDFSDTNWATIRQSVQEDRDAWRVGQSLLVQMLHQWVYEKWILAALAGGELPMDLFGDYFTNPDKYLAPKWQARSWEWVDPLKELKAKELANGNNLQTLAAQVAETTGEDLESTLIQRAYELQLLKALGLPTGPASKAQAQPAPEPEEDDEEEEEEDDEPEGEQQQGGSTVQDR